jgi:hypothetical protein
VQYGTIIANAESQDPVLTPVCPLLVCPASNSGN